MPGEMHRAWWAEGVDPADVDAGVLTDQLELAQSDRVIFLRGGRVGDRRTQRFARGLGSVQ